MGIPFPPFFRYKLYTDKEKAMITYEPLWETQTQGNFPVRSLTKFGMSRGMLDNLKHNRSITITTLDDLCTMLDCDITDILCYKKKKRKTRSYDIPFDISYPFWSFSVQNY